MADMRCPKSQTIGLNWSKSSGWTGEGTVILTAEWVEEYRRSIARLSHHRGGPVDMEKKNIDPLTDLAMKLEKVVRDHFQITGKERPLIGICFSLPENYQDCHWVTNLPRKEGIKLFRRTAHKMALG